MAKFLQELSPNNSVNTELAYRQIFNEIRIKTAAIITHSEKTQWETIIEKKGITKLHFERILTQAGLYKSLETTWDTIESSLRSENLGFLEIRRLKESWRTVNVTILSEPSNTPLNNTIQYVQRVIDECKSEPQSHYMNLSALMYYVLSKCSSPPSNLFNNDFIKGLILRQLNYD